MGSEVTCRYCSGNAQDTTMLPRPTDTVHASVIISELPAMRRMPAPTPLPTVRVPQAGLMARLGEWLAPRLTQRTLPTMPRQSAQVLVLRG
jgi:hypothetical protein